MTKEFNPAQTIGVVGEEIAVRHLLRRRWRITVRNWRCPVGEIDIIALDPDGVTVFCEVKTRTGTGFGDPLSAISVTKMSKMREVASVWLRAQTRRPKAIRFDAIGILIPPNGKPRLHHVAGICP